jgi:hypothetical protein
LNRKSFILSSLIRNTLVIISDRATIIAMIVKLPVPVCGKSPVAAIVGVGVGVDSPFVPVGVGVGVGVAVGVGAEFIVYAPLLIVFNNSVPNPSFASTSALVNAMLALPALVAETVIMKAEQLLDELPNMAPA